MEELEDKKQIFKKSIFRIKLNFECGILDILWLESFFVYKTKQKREQITEQGVLYEHSQLGSSYLPKNKK